MDEEGHLAVAARGSRTLADVIDARDQDRFVGRTRELKFLESCLGNEPPASVVFVWGPGGIGKSTLLRELTRRARVRAWEPFLIEGRELPPTPYGLDAALADSRQSQRPLVLIDTYERMTALDGYLRRQLLPSLPGDAVVVIAGRSAPDPAWLQGGWQEVVREIEMTGLPPDEAAKLLKSHGVGKARVPAIIDWASGSPLALTLAAETAARDPAWVPERAADTEILQPLLRRLLDSELHGERLSALAVAAIARVTTPDLLRAVLRDSDPDSAYERLRSLSFTEPVGDGLVLHEMIRHALLAHFRAHDADRERELRRRVVDYLYQARNDNPLVSIELAHLIDNPKIKWGYGWEGSIDYRIDAVREGDTEQVSQLLARAKLEVLWEHSQRYFTDAPRRVAVARDRDDRFCGYTIAMSPDTAPAFARQDPLLGPWIAHARRTSHLGNSVLWRDSIDFTGDPRGRVQAMLGMAGILRSGAPNPRFAYLPIDPALPAAVAFAQEVGAQHLAELDLDMGPVQIQCHRIDYGPGGLIAAQRAVVYHELGLPDPRGREDPDADLEAVRDALRNFRVPHQLARSPLAQGEDPEQRVESVRRLLRDGAERAFGSNDNEQLLKRVLVRGYLESESSHEQAAFDLNLSRAAYFRRLRAAAERLAEYLAHGGQRPPAGA